MKRARSNSLGRDDDGDDAGERAQLRDGPDSRVAALRCLETFASELPASLSVSLLEKLQSGVALVTDYSGMGQAEHALRRLQAWAAVTYDSPIPKHHGRAADIADHCREAIHARVSCTETQPVNHCFSVSFQTL